MHNPQHVLGVLGWPVAHSQSPPFFEQKFRQQGLSAEYRRLAWRDLSAFVSWARQEPRLRGFNVTLPHKTEVLAYLDDLSPQARAVGAVNTVTVGPDGRWWGTNTDVAGFGQSLTSWLGKLGRTSADLSSALVLGTGGAALAVSHALQEYDLERLHWVSRLPERVKQPLAPVRNYGELDTPELAEYDLLVNTTPLGMHPQLDRAPPLNYTRLGSHQLAYDLVYSPANTRFLQLCQAQGCPTHNGAEMLRLQAEAAWVYFYSCMLDADMPDSPPAG